MRLAGIAVAAAAAVVVFSTGPLSAGAQKQTETVDRTVPFPDNGTLKLKNFSGDVRITGTNGREVVVKAVRRAERDRLDHVKLDISTSGSTVTIDANKRDSSWHEDKDNVVETEFDIQVPAAATLEVDAFSSRVDIRGVSGRQTLGTFSGRITVADLKAALKAHTFSGGIEVDAAASGQSPDLDLETFSGDLRVHLASDAAGRVEFDSFSGSLDSDLPLTLHSTSRRRLSADLPGGAGRTLRLHTFSGDVRVTK